MQENENVYPSKQEAIDLLYRLNLPRHIINHVLAVSRKAVGLAIDLIKKNIDVDLELVKIGAILHDIGRSKVHGFEHASVGGDIIRELGLSENLARIAETHILTGLTKEEAKELNLPKRDYMPSSIEEKIVCFADKSYVGDTKVSINERFENWFARYGETDLLLKSKRRAEDLELEIYKLKFQ